MEPVMMAVVKFYLMDPDTGMYYAGRDYTKPKWTKNIQKAQGYHDIKYLDNMAKRLGNVKERLTPQELRVLKGQALSGDVSGATKGLARLLAQKDGRSW